MWVTIAATHVRTKGHGATGACTPPRMRAKPKPAGTTIHRRPP